MRKRNNSAPNRVGLIGTGKIGHGMAVNLIQAGHDVRVLTHKTRTAAEDLVKRGASEATSLRALVGECGVIFLCLPDSKVVEEIMLGVGGIVGVNRPGLMVIDTSTSQPESTRHIAREMQERGMAFADAPVLRSAVEAEAGTLISLFGGTHEIFDLVRPMIAAYSEQVIHFGPIGAGHTAKLINNIVTSGQAALLTEAMSVASGENLCLRSMLEVMSAGAANSGTLERLKPALLEGRMDVHQFSIGEARKDVSYFRALADNKGLSTPVSDAVHQVYTHAVNLGFVEGMTAALFSYQERLNGVSLLGSGTNTHKAS